MSISEWQNELDSFEQDAHLFEPAYLQQRMDVLQSLEQLFRFGRSRFGVRDGFHSLLLRADALQNRIDETNLTLFDALRKKIQEDGLADFDLRQVLNDFTTYRPEQKDFLHDRDGLDPLIHGTFDTMTAPDPELDAVADMVWLEMTPISAILELVDRVGFTSADTFMDIGSGQGQICLLIHLLTRARTIGIEIDPAYIERAESVVRSICGETSEIAFRQSDARVADYRAGTVFFMFTPFRGRIFEVVMEQLRSSIFSTDSPNSSTSLNRGRPLICTYGDITLDVAKLSWLNAQCAADVHPCRPCIFEISDLCKTLVE